MRATMVAIVLLLGLALPALAQKANESDGTADVLNSLMLKAGDRCYGLAEPERATCCARYFDNLCGPTSAPVAASLAAPVPERMSTAPATQPTPAMPATRQNALSGGDGPAEVLNGFMLKTLAQCRQSDAAERQACCQRLMHPNACRL